VAAATASSRDHCTVGSPAEGRSHCAQKFNSSFMRYVLSVFRVEPGRAGRRLRQAGPAQRGGPGAQAARAMA